MNETGTMVVSASGQGTLPEWWREASGLASGGVVEVRAISDGSNSLLLTPKQSARRGISGRELLEQFAKCPQPIDVAERHEMPFRWPYSGDTQHAPL